MTQFIPFSRDQAFLLPPDAKDRLPADDVAHFVVAAVEHVPLGAFAVHPIPGGKAQYHPWLPLALLIYAYANGIFPSRRIERATHRDIADLTARAEAADAEGQPDPQALPRPDR